MIITAVRRWPEMVNKQYIATEVPESTIQIKNQTFFLFHTADTATMTRCSIKQNYDIFLSFFSRRLLSSSSLQRQTEYI